jgi:hypothetical protein
VQVLFIQAVGGTVVGPAIGFVEQNTKEWITAIILGVIILPVGVVTRLLPLKWFPGITDEESNARAMAEGHARVAAAQARVTSEAKDVAISMPSMDRRASMERRGLAGITEKVVGSRLSSRQSRLSDVSDSSAPIRREKSFKVFAHAVIAANRLQQKPGASK